MYDTIHIDSGNVKMIAHRGLSGLEKENSASAFVAAGNRSHYGIETDVHRTGDGRYIIIHDDNTVRVCGDEMIVEKTSYNTLRSLRLLDTDGVWGRCDLMLPNLTEYASICRKYEKWSVLELKNHFKPADIDGIIEEVRAAGQLEKTIFISFDLANMVCLREKLPEQPAQLLMGDYTDWLIDTLVKYHLDLDIRYTALKPEHVARLHELGIKVNVWTVDKPEDAQRMIEYGVDFITSNILE